MFKVNHLQMLKHLSNVLNANGNGVAVKTDLQESLFLNLDNIFHPTDWIFEPIWNILDWQLLLTSTYYDFNVWATFDFIALENWRNYISGIICVWIEINIEFVATNRSTNLKESIENVFEKLFMVAEMRAVKFINSSSKLNHVWVF